jgi:hypothetical protein
MLDELAGIPKRELLLDVGLVRLDRLGADV